jgi:hypothetical protein
VNDQETEKSALCSKLGVSSQMGAKMKKKLRNDNHDNRAKVERPDIID